ncbi:MAG: site-specific DNA-methyltransferase [Nannocystaceae bacterium]|nr:site-specific DNA-methyltransferase [Nannocystaceae bacterium]
MEGYGLTFAGKAAAIALLDAATRSHLVAEPGWDPASPSNHAFIEGDNLEVLKLLVPAYAGRVDCIYIDPPYNTGHDFVYRDRWAEGADAYLLASGQRDTEGNVLVANPVTSGRYHSAWLAMMLPRLTVARQLLAETGVLFVSIDDHEVANLRLLLDEVLGASCFIGQIVVVSNRGGRDYLRIATTHEYILCYGKTPDAPIAELPRAAAPGARTDDRGLYELRELRNRNPKFTPANRPNLAYPIWVDPTAQDDANGTFAIALSPSEGSIEIIPKSSKGAGSVWRWGQPKLAAALVAGNAAASEVVARPVRGGGWRVFEKSRKSTTKVRSLWDEPAMRSERGTQALRQLMGAAVFDHPKPVELVARCLTLGMPADGLALDFFAGAGTMAHAASSLNTADGGTRRTISVNLDEPTPPNSEAAAQGLTTVSAIGRARIERALPDGESLRAFRLGESDAAAASPWHAALAGGARLDARPTRVGEHAWCFVDGTGRQHLVFLGSSLTRAEIETWALPVGARVSCRAQALDDSATLFLARRFALTRY